MEKGNESEQMFVVPENSEIEKILATIQYNVGLYDIGLLRIFGSENTNLIIISQLLVKNFLEYYELLCEKNGCKGISRERLKSELFDYLTFKLEKVWYLRLMVSSDDSVCLVDENENLILKIGLIKEGMSNKINELFKCDISGDDNCQGQTSNLYGIYTDFGLIYDDMLFYESQEGVKQDTDTFEAKDYVCAKYDGNNINKISYVYSRDDDGKVVWSIDCNNICHKEMALEITEAGIYDYVVKSDKTERVKPAYFRDLCSCINLRYISEICSAKKGEVKKKNLEK